jgi:dolichol-phosphate mannosyltransferase
MAPVYICNWAVVVPMANEEVEFAPFIRELQKVLDQLCSGSVYLVIDRVSKDKTYDLCLQLSKNDSRFTTIWAEENRNIVDAYLRGFREAYQNGHKLIIEMDAGMSHDPWSIPMFLRVLSEGYECAFGSRFIDGGAMDGPMNRRLLSRGGTFLANKLLGTHFHDMTSGFQGFHANIVSKLLRYQLLSKAHFYQTEVRYLLRKHRYAEIPIHYKAPSPRVSSRAITNSIFTLIHYFILRITGRSSSL